ncbi:MULTISPECIES: glycosyltransferase [Flectobacillus]|jgi:glycogen(starch) synthase|uniref:Glycosyltransferase n=1 Tax=Flectobacillus roseus TaxID=502259 RepID=A0ABT6YA87_9BACT|nr:MULTISPECIES: glycosyltransferase [Flectobacillus]MDI9860498.1 glycosyltransferase [Flectobacillus roseus]MDI9869917.1 glycosyltransferase [Flectobacillus roseus]MDI9881735.1 glycosyltransferase [Flectobacillus longus]NBA74766.1 glycosyltransferase [Emticicia sp. ODNR4P]
MEIQNPLQSATQKQKILIEIAWETCNQVGGIYTVIRTKVPSMVEKWGDDYFLLGPYFPQTASAEFEPIHDLDDSVLGKTVQKMRSMGYGVHYGYWLVTGKPRIVLFDFWSIYNNINALKAGLWERHQVSTLNTEELVSHVIAFGEMVRVFLTELAKEQQNKIDIVAHFHEWMAASAIPDLRKDQIKVATVFTTHATMLGRYLAGNVPNFYDKIDTFDWLKEARHYGIEAQATLERLAALQAHVTTTVSDVTAKECEFLLGKVPDLILPNGLNITRFSAMHEHQNLHTKYKDRINEFVMGHFFQSQPFNLEKTLYFFTSGRYEYSNKGYDLTLEALARLNWKMKQAKIDKTVVMFFITKQPYHSIDPEVLHSRAVMDEIRETCNSIEKQVGEQLFKASASSSDLQMPDLNNFVDEYWRLRLRRTIQTWKNNKRPKVVTHLLKQNDGITDFVQKSNLMNNPEDKVKIVYHPDFIVSTNPLFGLDYGQFVRGCNLGVFPSYYEPWGYTPLECIARGVPTITSDLSGFGDYMMQIMRDYEHWGVMVVNRKTQDFYKAAEQLSEMLLKFVKQSLRERITQRNRVESISDTFDWSNLRTYYDTSHDLALKRRK